MLQLAQMSDSETTDKINVLKVEIPPQTEKANQVNQTDKNQDLIKRMDTITSEVSKELSGHVLKLFSQKLSEDRLMYEPVVKPLLILDLNGILVYRNYAPNSSSSDDKIPDGAIRRGNFIIWKRPGLEKFLEYVFHNFNVAVWSSVSKRNLDPLIEVVFGPLKQRLLFSWDQSRCEKTNHPLTNKKPLFLKNLSEVWKEYSMFDEKNTLIIDDTSLKMQNNPSDCCIILHEWKPKEKRSEDWNQPDEYYHFKIDKGLLLRLSAYLTVPSRTLEL